MSTTTPQSTDQSLIERAVGHIKAINADPQIDWSADLIQFERSASPPRIGTTVYFTSIATTPGGETFEQCVTLPLSEQQYWILIGCVARGRGALTVETPAEMRWGSQILAGVTVINAALVSRIERRAEVNVIRVPRPDAGPEAAQAAIRDAALPF